MDLRSIIYPLELPPVELLSLVLPPSGIIFHLALLLIFLNFFPIVELIAIVCHKGVVGKYAPMANRILKTYSVGYYELYAMMVAKYTNIAMLILLGNFIIQTAFVFMYVNTIGVAVDPTLILGIFGYSIINMLWYTVTERYIYVGLILGSVLAIAVTVTGVFMLSRIALSRLSKLINLPKLVKK